MPALLFFLVAAASPFAGTAAWRQGPQLILELRAQRGDLRAGDEIPMSFVIRNVGTTSYTYSDRNYDRSGRMGEYRLQAFDERGAPLADPRTVPGYIGGGLSVVAELRPGESFTKTVALNLWALIAAPGVYTVRGSYVAESGAAVNAASVTIRILPRSDSEMAEYISGLAEDLRRAGDTRTRPAIVRRLMYTADRRAVRPLLAAMPDADNNTSFWIGDAFSYYLPKDGAILRDALSTIRRQGLWPSSLRVLEQLQASRNTILELIGLSLEDERDAVQGEAVLAAQRYPDDRFMRRLIQCALRGRDLTRERAIYAVAGNRTDAGVAALRTLRRDPHPEIRKITERALDTAYRMSESDPGRRLRPDDFPDIAKRQAFANAFMMP